MNWFKKLFKKKEVKVCTTTQLNQGVIQNVKSYPKGFIIEHYPRTNKYTVAHNEGWLKTQSQTNIIRIEALFQVVDFYNSEKEAMKSISLYKEQAYKDGVTFTKVD